MLTLFMFRINGQFIFQTKLSIYILVCNVVVLWQFLGIDAYQHEYFHPRRWQITT
jgi:hypothetical protein